MIRFSFFIPRILVSTGFTGEGFDVFPHEMKEAIGRFEKYIKKDTRVLDICCGMKELTFYAAGRGARIRQIDTNKKLQKTTRDNASVLGLSERFDFASYGVRELYKEANESFDVVLLCLSLSGMSRDELLYTLKHSKRMLARKGLIVIADEIVPDDPWKRFVYYIKSVFRTLMRFIIFKKPTRPLTKIISDIRDTGLFIVSSQSNKTEDFITVFAHK
jgi:ubiquinone/menaquinone biosynthesis C-methylase UbiE